MQLGYLPGFSSETKELSLKSHGEKKNDGRWFITCFLWSDN